MLRAEVLEFAEEFSEFLFDNPEHNNDKEVVLVAVKNNPEAYKYASIELQADEDVINAWKLNIDEWRTPLLESYLRNKHFDYLFQGYPQLCNDKETIIRMVKKFPDAYEYASEYLQSDDDIISTIIDDSHDVQMLLHWDDIGFPFYKHEKFMLGVLRLYPGYFDYSCYSEEFKADKDFMLSAVNRDGLLLEIASDKLKSDKVLITVAVANDCDAIKYASEELRCGGLKAYLMEYIKPKIVFLCGCIPTTANKSPLFKLNLHGRHFAKLFKKKILEFSEDQFDEYVIEAIQNLK